MRAAANVVYRPGVEYFATAARSVDFVPGEVRRSPTIRSGSPGSSSTSYSYSARADFGTLPGNFEGDAFARWVLDKVAEEQSTIPGFVTYDSDSRPLWEFGTWPSYTTFQYSVMTPSSATIHTNDLYASTAPDARRLRKFTR